MVFDWLAREGGHILGWWALTTLAGAAALPLCFRLLGSLPDRGYLFARAAGLLLTGYVFWLLASFGWLQNTPGSIAFAWVIVLGISLAVYGSQFTVHGSRFGNAGGQRAAGSERDSAPSTEYPELRTRNPELRTRNPELRTQNPELRTQNSEPRTQNPEPGILRSWWRANRAGILVGEVLFIVLLFAWAFIRAHNPDTWSTEKPMDLMMMSAIMRSESFPPNDAWLSGYAISYYYFGYLMAAMLGKLSAVAGTVAFSLHLSLLFALTALTAYGVGYNLVRAHGRWRRIIEPVPGLRLKSAPFAPPGRSRAESVSSASSPLTERGPGGEVSPILTGLLAACFVVLLGNFQAALIEVPYQSRAASEAYLAFWDTPERAEYPARTTARINGIPDSEAVDAGIGQDMLSPNFSAFWWWFRASRVLQDREIDGRPVGAQPIDEFPQFSFLLGDVHPHVMALPFVLFTIGLALNLSLTPRAPSRGEIIFYGLAVGALIFLNTWDGPIYLLALVGADAVRRIVRAWARHTLGETASESAGVFSAPLTGRDWLALVGLGAALAALAVVFYLPFLIGFRSQAAGILPNWYHPTLLRQFFIMFGPFILILLPYLAIEAWRSKGQMHWRLGLQTAAMLLAALLTLMLALTLIGALTVGLPPGWAQTVPDMLVKRITHGLVSVMLLAGVAVVISRLFGRDEGGEPISPATGFVLLLIGVGVGFALLPEYIYLRDGFGVRMNTVFKFYYQAWVVFSLASAYAVYHVLGAAPLRGAHISPLMRAAFGGLAALALTFGLVYPVLGIYNRALQESGRLLAEVPPPLTLDGGPAHFIRGDPEGEDYYAIVCLGAVVQGDDVVIAEAFEGTYNPNFGRVGALTGLPVVFNWPGHQSQWRGPTFAESVGTREADIVTLYTSEDWNTVQAIIDRYGIDYIFFGRSERNKYSPAAETKFRDRLESECIYGDSGFYVVPSG